MIVRFSWDLRRARRVRGGAAVLAAGLAIASCSGSSSGKEATTSTTVTSAPQSAAPPAGSADVQTQLHRLSVQESDAPGYFVHLYPQGDQVAGQVTLDLCGGNFPSEALRIGRYEVGVAQSSQSNLLFSTEAVAYGDLGGPTQAFSELSAVAAHCPDSFVQGPVAGEPSLKTVFGPAPDQDWPTVAGVDRLAFDATVSDQQGQSLQSIAVYLRRGRFLLALYFDDPTHPPVIDGQSTVQGIVTLFAQRLVSVPPTAA